MLWHCYKRCIIIHHSPRINRGTDIPRFSYNAVYNPNAFGVDLAGGHPEESGEYYYRAFIINGWNREVKQMNTTTVSNLTMINLDIQMDIVRL